MSRGRILVTGATGFVGSEVVRRATYDGWWVRGLVRRMARSDAAEMIVADILDQDGIYTAMDGMDCVIHAAGLAHTRHPSWEEWYAANVRSTYNVVSAAVKAAVRHVILVSSVSVYGPSGAGLRDESAACGPEGGYARSKHLAESAAMELVESTQTALTILRLSTVYGEGDRGNIARFIRTIDANRFVWIGRCDNRKSLIYKTDVARAILAAVHEGGQGVSIYNVSAEAYTVRELVVTICSALRKPVPRVTIPAAVAKAAAAAGSALSRGVGRVAALSNDLQKLLADDAYDGSKFKAKFSFREETALAEGLRREADWLLRAEGGRVEALHPNFRG